MSRLIAPEDVPTTPAPRTLSRFDACCWRLLIWGLGLATPLLAALKPRRFVVGEIEMAEAAEAVGNVASKGLYLAFLILAIVALFRRFGAGETVRGGRGFWGLTLLLAALPTLSTLLSGGAPTMSLLGALAIYAATYLLATPPLPWLMRQLRLMLVAVFVYGSLAVALLFPEWAWNPGYGDESSLALLPMRLYGTAAHANTLAPLVIYAWMLGRLPGCRLRGEGVHLPATALVLLLTQSKTNLMLALFMCALYLLVRICSLGRFRKYLVFSALGCAGGGLLLYLVKFTNYGPRLLDLMYDPQVITLSGRLPLWLLALDMWLERPWLGHGLDAWSSTASLEYFDFLGWGATHAHNQLLQALSQTGLVGLAVLLLWSLGYYRIVARTPRELQVPLYWITAFFSLAGFTEVILHYSLGQGGTLITWMLSLTALVCARIYAPSAE